MTNLKIYQICHYLITYFVTLTSPKKVNCDSYLGPKGVPANYVASSLRDMGKIFTFSYYKHCRVTRSGIKT